MTRFFFLFLLISPVIRSQSSLLSHGAFREGSNMEVINRRAFYLLKSSQPGSCCADTIRLVGISQTGSQLFNSFFVKAPELNEFDIMVTGSRLVLRAQTSNQFCNGNTLYTYLAGADTNGVISWTLGVPAQVLGITAAPNNHCKVWTAATVSEYDMGGQLVGTVSHSIVSLLGVTNYTGNATVVHRYAQGTASLQIVDNALQVLKSAVALPGYTLLRTSADGGIIAADAQAIYKYSPNLSLLHTMYCRYKVLCTRNDSVFAGTDDGSGTAGTLVADSTFLNPQVDTVHGSAGCSGVAVVGDRLKLLCLFKHGNVFEKSAALLSRNITGAFTAYHDLELRRVDITSAQVVPLAGTNAYQLYASASATIINNGNTTNAVFGLNLINFENTPDAYCYFGLNKSYPVSIPPGGYVTVQTGTFLASRSELVGSPLSLCFFITGPNDLLDQKYVNDRFCAYFDNPLGIAKYSISGCRVSPQPAHDQLQIQSPVMMQWVDLYNYSGQFMSRFYLSSDSAYLDISPLPPGLYLLRVSVAGREEFIKVIRE